MHVADGLLHLAGRQVVSQTVGIPLFNLTVEDRLPSGLTFVSASSGGVYDPSTRTIRWLLGTLGPGASVTLSYAATVDAAGNWTNAACAAANDEQGNITGDCADVTVSGGQPAPPPPGPPPSTATPTPTPTSTVTPTATVTPTLRPGAPTYTPIPTRTNTPTPTPTPIPPPILPTPVTTPTLTVPEEEVLEEVEEIVREREPGTPVQVPVQVPGK